MDKNLRPGSKLDVTAALNDEEIELKSSLVKAVDDKLQITTPMRGGKGLSLPPGTSVAVSISDDDGRYTFQGVVEGPIKQGVRTNWIIGLTADAEWVERRAHCRIPVDLEMTITNYETDLEGERREVSYSGRTTDISNGGLALLTSAPMAVGEVIRIEIKNGRKKLPLRGEVCWWRPAPKNSGYHYSAGLQFLFRPNETPSELYRLTASLSAKK